MEVEQCDPTDQPISESPVSVSETRNGQRDAVWTPPRGLVCHLSRQAYGTSLHARSTEDLFQHRHPDKLYRLSIILQVVISDSLCDLQQMPPSMLVPAQD